MSRGPPPPPAPPPAAAHETNMAMGDGKAPGPTQRRRRHRRPPPPPPPHPPADEAAVGGPRTRLHRGLVAVLRPLLTNHTLLRQLCALLTLAQLIGQQGVLADINRRLHISSLCIRDPNIPLSQRIDGAVITSIREENLNCVLTFQTELVSQRFMLRFENLALDCNDHLYIFDGDVPNGNHKADLSCRSTRADVGTIYTQGNFVTLRYVTDKWSKADDGFKLIIAAFKDTPSLGCTVFRCLNSFCISAELACDGVNHCGDNSDETSHALCYPLNNDLIFGLEVSLFIALVIVVFVACLVCVVSLAVCLCRREHQLQEYQQRVTGVGSRPGILAHPASFTGGPGGTIQNSGSARFATLPLEKIRDKPPPPYPGNMFTPAAGNHNNHHHHNNHHNDTDTDHQHRLQQQQQQQQQHIIGNNTPLQQVVYFSEK